MDLKSESIRLDDIMGKVYQEWLEQLEEVEASIKALTKTLEATEKTDLSENATYTITRDERDMKISSKGILLEKIEAYKEGREEYIPSGVVKLGSTVLLEVIRVDGHATSVEFHPLKIVKDKLTSTVNGLLSNESKAGAALIGLRCGDTFEIQVPIGILTYRVKEVY